MGPCGRCSATLRENLPDACWVCRNVDCGAFALEKPKTNCRGTMLPTIYYPKPEAVHPNPLRGGAQNKASKGVFKAMVPFRA